VVDSNYFYGANATQVKAGDVVSVATTNGTARKIVAGVLDEVYLHGIFMSKQQMLQYFPAITGDTLFLIKSENGMKPIDLSYDLKKGYKIAGINAFAVSTHSDRSRPRTDHWNGVGRRNHITISN
jgi:hypothetical protein